MDILTFISEGISLLVRTIYGFIEELIYITNKIRKQERLVVALNDMHRLINKILQHIKALDTVITRLLSKTHIRYNGLLECLLS